MSLRWHFQSYTHVRSSVVIKIYIFAYDTSGMINIREFPTVNRLNLDNTIYTFGNGIVRRFIILSHAYCYVVPL